MKKKNEKINVLSSYENTMVHKERFNPFQTGYGVHQTDKHPKRAKSKNGWKKDVKKYL